MDPQPGSRWTDGTEVVILDLVRTDKFKEGWYQYHRPGSLMVHAIPPWYWRDNFKPEESKDAMENDTGH